MSEIKIQIGYGESAQMALIDATEEWVWSRIHELREQGLCSQFKLLLDHEGERFIFSSPRDGNIESRRVGLDESSKIRQIGQLWRALGLNHPDYEASAAIAFICKFIQLFPEFVVSEDSRASA